MPETFCSYYNQGLCRSCSDIARDYESQLRRKEERLLSALSLFPKIQLDPTVPSATTGFRNRAKMSVTGTLENPIIGLTGEESLDAGRELLHCPIHHPKLNEVIAKLPDFIRTARLTPYRIRERDGELKGLIAFYSPESDQMLLRFVLRSTESILRLKKWLPDLLAQFPRLQCVTANIQPVPHAILEGTEEVFLTARKSIDHPLGGIALTLAPQAFVQTNAKVATELYRTAAEWIGQSGARRVLELFSGQGAFSFFAAKNSGEFLGVEINAEAVKTANDTAARLKMPHLRFLCADAARVQESVTTFAPDLILANPPRRGLGRSLELIRSVEPKHFLYSSCAVETLACDVAKLAPTYQLMRARIFDMFPHTSHFETLLEFKIAHR